jgi:hypothetical protein
MTNQVPAKYFRGGLEFNRGGRLFEKIDRHDKPVSIVGLIENKFP